MKISNFSLAIGVPLSFPWVPSSFFHSFVMMEKPNYTYLQADNGPIHELRNNLVEKALSVGATNLLMCDIDQVYHPKTVTRLLSHKLPIVHALVHRRYVPFDSLMLKQGPVDENTDGYVSIDEWEDGALVEVDACGGGCAMYDMDVFRKVPYPWFQNVKQANGMPIGEDIKFAQDAKAAGYRIFVDTSVPAGHLAHLIVNTATNRLYRACKSTQAAKQALETDSSC